MGREGFWRAVRFSRRQRTMVEERAEKSWVEKTEGLEGRGENIQKADNTKGQGWHGKPDGREVIQMAERVSGCQREQPER